MLSLAAPVVMAELGWVTMGIVDTVMVGGLGADAIGAVGLASMLFLAVAIFAMGLLLGLDPLVAQAYGASRLDECHRWLIDGVWLCVIITGPVIACLFALSASLGAWGLPTDVLRLTRPYLDILTWSLPPLLLYVGVPPVPSRSGYRPAGDGRAHRGQSRQRPGQLDVDLRSPGRASHGRAWLGLGDARCAHLHGWLVVRRGAEVRRRSGAAAARHVFQARPGARGASVRARPAGRRSGGSGSRRLRGGHRARRAGLGARAGGAPDRAEHGGVHVHGAVRSGVGGGGSGRPCGRPAEIHTASRVPDGRRSASASRS